MCNPSSASLPLILRRTGGTAFSWTEHTYIHVYPCMYEHIYGYVYCMYDGG